MTGNTAETAALGAATAMAVIIEHTIRRTGGTEINMPSGIEYHFKPRAADDKRHLERVENPADMTLFLQQPTFRIVEAAVNQSAVGHVETASTGVTAGAAVPGAAPKTDSDASTGAAETASTDATATDVPNADPSRDATPPTDATPAVVPLAELPDADLRVLFQTEVGRAPSANAKPETMIAQIEAKRKEAADATPPVTKSKGHGKTDSAEQAGGGKKSSETSTASDPKPTKAKADAKA